MAEIEVKRNYNLTDSELCMFVSNLCNFLTRDLTDFAPLGLTALKIADFKALGDAFEVFPTDGSLIGDVMITTENKNALREQVLLTIKSMALRVEQKWGANSGKYRRLDLKTPSSLNDDGVLTTARSVHTKVSEYLADLAGFGLTQAMLDDFEDLNEEFEKARNAQTDATANRDVKRVERITKGNELYSLVTFYCNYGKMIFEKTNPAKYNSYIIYTATSPGSLTPPQGLRFWFTAKRFYWEMVENASSYQLMASTDGENFFEIYAGSDLECEYIPVQNGYMWYKCRGRNQNGYGGFSETLKQGYYDILPAPSNLNVILVSGSTNSVKLTFDAVPSATNYKVYRSSVAIGAPAGGFNVIDNTAINEFIETVNVSQRHYYHVLCENENYQASVISANVFIDIA